MDVGYADASARFWRKVEYSSACWIWRGGLDTAGYGQFSFGGKAMQAHRFAWLVCFGEPPPPMVLHRCDVRTCVHPLHLYNGTAADNARDRAERRRNPHAASPWWRSPDNVVR